MGSLVSLAEDKLLSDGGVMTLGTQAVYLFLIMLIDKTFDGEDRSVYRIGPEYGGKGPG